MTSTNFQVVTVRFMNGPDHTGTIYSSGTATFDTNVKNAGAAISSWKLSYGGDNHEIKNAGVSISNVRPNGRDVTFDASLQLENDHGKKISQGDAQLEVLVIAYLDPTS